jgi:hypothetical protein
LGHGAPQLYDAGRVAAIADHLIANAGDLLSRGQHAWELYAPAKPSSWPKKTKRGEGACLAGRSCPIGNAGKDMTMIANQQTRDQARQPEKVVEAEL